MMASVSILRASGTKSGAHLILGTMVPTTRGVSINSKQHYFSQLSDFPTILRWYNLEWAVVCFLSYFSLSELK